MPQIFKPSAKKILKPGTIKAISFTIALVSLSFLITIIQKTQNNKIVAQAPGDQVLLSDSFDSGMSDWTPFLNQKFLNDQQWYWENGEVHFDPERGDTETADDALLMYTGDNTTPYYWHNYTFDVDAKGSHMGIWFRGKYKESAMAGRWVTGYYLTLLRREARLYKIQTPDNCVSECDNMEFLYHFSSPTLLASQPFTNDKYRFFHIRATVNESSIQIWINDIQFFNHTDGDFQYGTVGLFSYAHEATFDNVVVRGTPVYDTTPPECRYQVPGVLAAFEGVRIYLKGSLSQDLESGIKGGSWSVTNSNGSAVSTINSLDGYLTGLVAGNYTATLTMENNLGMTSICSQDINIYSPEILEGSVLVNEVTNYTIPSYTGALDPSPPHADNNPKRAAIVSWPGKNYRFVFWHEASYVPFWEFPNGTGANYQFFEGARSSGELFNMYGRIDINSNFEIVQNNDKLVIIKWWYYDVNKDTGDRAAYAEEYWYFFPNGLVLREMGLRWGISFEPMEIMVINPVGTYWWDNIQQEGGQYHMSSAIDIYTGLKRDHWAIPTSDINKANSSVTGAPEGEIEKAGGVLMRTYLKDYEDPYIIYGDNSFVSEGDIKEWSKYQHFVHWPIGWLNSEWKEATEDEIRTYPTHTSTLGTNISGYDDPFYWLIGISNKTNTELKEVGQDWLTNPTLPGMDALPPITRVQTTPTPSGPTPTPTLGPERCMEGLGIISAIGCIPVNDTQSFLEYMLPLGFSIAGGIAFILMIVGGIMVMKSGGDPKSAQAGKELITAAVAGLMFLFFGVFLLEFIGFDILNIPEFGR